MAVTVASEINQVPASRFVGTLKDVREAKDSKAAHAQERKRMRNEPGKFSLAKGCELGTQSVPDASPSRRMHVQARLFSGGEFKQVREVAAEVFGRLSPRRTAPLLTRALACVEAGGGSGVSGKVEAVDDDAARTAILVLCHAFACHGVVPEYSKLSLILQRLLVGSCCPVRTSSANDSGGASDSQGSDAAGTQDTSAQGAGGSSAGDM